MWQALATMQIIRVYMGLFRVCFYNYTIIDQIDKEFTYQYHSKFEKAISDSLQVWNLTFASNQSVEAKVVIH